MSSRFEKLKVFLSLPTALVLFLTSSIAAFIVISEFSNWTTYDETTWYGYGYGYGYDPDECVTKWITENEQFETTCYYEYNYGYGHNPDTITTTGDTITNTWNTSTGSIWWYGWWYAGGCLWCNYDPEYENIHIDTEKVRQTIDDFSQRPLTDEEKKSIENSVFNTETTLAYLYAKAFGITTLWSIEEAHPEQGTTRAQLAKMMVQFATNVLWKSINDPVRRTMCTRYWDVDAWLWDLAWFIVQACEAKIMGLQIDETTPLKNFSPHTFVTRWEILTVLWRMIFNNKFKDMDPYYIWYMNAFFKAGIIKVNDPTLLDIRAHIWIILQRTHDRLAHSGK